MAAATTPEWIEAFAIGTAAYLPIVTAVLLSGRDLPHLSAEPVRGTAQRARLVLALARHLETGRPR